MFLRFRLSFSTEFSVGAGAAPYRFVAFFFFQRARAASAAPLLRFSSVIFAALGLPPIIPPCLSGKAARPGRWVRDVAQRLDDHLGKIIHIPAEGAPASDNPFIENRGFLPETCAYGIRSPEGLAFDPRTGRLWENEHGPRGGDELNIIEKGENYGWQVRLPRYG
jgi:hypothetical protein